VDWAFWSDSGRTRAGMWPVVLGGDGSTSPMQPDRSPIVEELNATDLSIVQALKGGGAMSIVCSQKEVTFTGVDAQGKPLSWAFEIVGGARLKSLVKKVTTTEVIYNHTGVDYRLQLGSRAGSCRQLENGSIQLAPNAAGRLVLKMDVSRGRAL